MRYYSTEIMKRLGIMIEYKRNQYIKTDSRWRIGEFLRVNEDRKICDWKTYKKIKGGSIVFDDIIYDELIEALGYSSSNLTTIIEIFDQLAEDLMVPAEYYDVNKIVSLCENAKTELLKYPNGFLVDDYCLLIKHIVGNYRDGTYLNDEEYSRLKGMYDCSGPEMNAIIIDLMYQYLARYIGDLDLINQFVEANENIIKRHNFLMSYYCEYLMFNQREEESKIEAIKLRETYVNQENTVRELLMDMFLFNIFDGLFNREYYFYYDDIEKIFERESEVPKRISLAVKCELGMYLYCNKLYSQSFNYFKICYSEDINRYYYCYIFCVDINKISFVEDVEVDLKFVSPLKTSKGIYYYYYQQKKLGVSINTLEQYLITRIRPLIDVNSFFYRIFMDELLEFIDKTHHYKLLKVWNEVKKR